MANLAYDFKEIALFERTNREPLELAARFGYLAKGLVYSIVGVLAVMTAVSFVNGTLTDTRGAITKLSGEPWSPFVLGFLALGLVGFFIWRATQSIKDTEGKGTDVSGIVKRIGLMGSGLIYASLAFYTGRLLVDSASGSSSTQQRAAEVMAHDGGVLLVGIAGIIFLIVGLYQLYRAYTDKFKRNWKTVEMSPGAEKTATWISRFGISARAVAFVLISTFLMKAALTADPDKAQGLEGALTNVAQSTSGQWVVAIAGLGLLSYGIYCFVNALFRRIEGN